MSVRVFLGTLTERRVVLSTNVNLSGAQSAPEAAVIKALPEPMTVKPNGVYHEEKNP